MRRHTYRFLFLFVTFFIATKTRSQQGDTLVVHFEFNKSDITSAARLVIDNYFSAKKQQVQSVQLSGYCDNIGKPHYNDSLSFARVKAVRAYLLSSVVEPDFITAETGWGENFPRNNNRTAVERAINRRVEITIDRIIAKPVVDTPESIKTTIPPQPKKVSLAEQINDTATKAGSNIVLENIIFFGGRHFPMQVSAPALYDLLQVMQTNPALQIEIDGYVCCEPDGQDGMDADTRQKNLSVERAKYIYDYLRKNGIDKSRMRYAGFGGSHKRYPEEKDYREQTLNRRVEIKIVSK